MGILPGYGPLGSGPTGPGSGFSVMPINLFHISKSDSKNQRLQNRTSIVSFGNANCFPYCMWAQR